MKPAQRPRSSPTSTTARPRWSTACCNSLGSFREKPARRRTRDGLERSRARTRHHDSSPRRPRSCGRTHGSTSSTPRVTPTSVARSSAFSIWWTARSSSSMAAEGPLPQTKFVVLQGAQDRPAADRRHQTKVDRSDARPGGGRERGVRTCFAALGTPTEEQLDFPVLYGLGQGRPGWRASVDGPKESMAPLFDLILQHVRAAEGGGRSVPVARHDPRGQFPISERIVTGRISSGSIKPNQAVKVIDPPRQAGGAGPRLQGALRSAGSSACRSTKAMPGTSSRSPDLPLATVAHTHLPRPR